MRKWLIAVAGVLLAGALVATDADARRLGGARSSGVQRNVTAPPPSTPAKQAQPASPNQQQAAPAGAQAQGAAAQPSGLSRWMPMLGGLAIGGLLGSMLGGSGLGSLLLIALLVFGAVLAFRAFARRRSEVPQPLQYAGVGNETVPAPPPSQAAGLAPLAAVSAKGTQLPAGFDAAGFLRAAKMNFVKLQVANDQGKLDELREFTTGEMFEALRGDIAARGAQRQDTNVVTLNADLLELATEGNRHWASVRFSGMVRETAGGAPEGFEEVWNLVKPADGSTGWLLAGIQQMH